MVNVQRLEQLLNSLAEWTPETHVSEPEYCLISLVDEALPESYYPRLKSILANNQHFKDKDFRNYIKNPAYISDGAWWFDPATWT